MLQTKLAQLLQLLFNQKKYTQQLVTTHAQPIEIINYGTPAPNTQPPTNENATLKIGDQMLRGNIAFRHLASDFQNERTANDNTILCIVAQNNNSVCRSNGEAIPVALLEIPQEKEEIFRKMLRGEYAATCAKTFAQLEPVNQYNLISRLTIERLERKCNDILQLYHQSQNNWNEAFYCTLFRSLGASKNQAAYIKLAQSVSYSQICHVKESVQSVEALLMGTAGFLEMEFPDDYICALKVEFEHLRRRFSIKPMRPSEWVFGQQNPNAHPIIRVAELASLLVSEEFIFSRVLACRTPDDIVQVLSAKASSYWDTHSLPAKESDSIPKVIGAQMLKTFGINLVVPMMFTVGSQNGDEELKERAIEILEMIESENNQYLRTWSSAGVKIENAFAAQGLLQQSKEYCEKKECARCNIGQMLLYSKE